MDSEIKPLINILIRTSNRRNEFLRCLKSITSQTYPNIRIIISYDNPKALEYIPEPLEKVFVTADRSLPYFYDKYIGDLMQLVIDGYIQILDDDDVLMPGVLSKIVFDSPAIIHQLKRANNIVPINLNFRRGQIGFPCLLLHHSLKSIAQINGTGQGDYFWIKDVEKHVPLVFRELIVVYSWGRGLGKCG